MKLNRRKRLWILALLLLLLAGAYGIRQQRARLRLEHARALAQQASSEQTRKLSERERRALHEQVRAAMSQLDRGQRAQLFQAQRQTRTAELKQLLKLPMRQQNARLEQEIRQAEQRRQQMAQAQISAGAGNRSNLPGTSTGRPRTVDPAQREARAKQRLDNTTPEERAVWSQYRQLVNQRRSELGLPPSSGRGWR
jgi:hypothetical protein